MRNLNYIYQMLFLHQHIDEVKPAVSEQFRERIKFGLFAWNKKWETIKIERKDIDFRTLLSLDWFDISHTAPLFSFSDEGYANWSYLLIHKGEIVSSVEIRDDIEFDIWSRELQDQNPNLAPREIINLIYSAKDRNEKLRRIRETKEYKNRIHMMYRNHDADAFSALHLPETEIEILRNAITSDSYNRTNVVHENQVEIFKRTLGLDHENEK